MKNTFLIIIFLFSPKISYSKQISLEEFKAKDGGLKKEFLYQLREWFNHKVFIETGTSSGDTTWKAALTFDTVYSSELSHNFYQQACYNLKNHKNIHLYQGSSDIVLLNILPAITEPIIFWLDAHYCGEATARGESDSPILQELQAIKSCNKKESVIMIDDLRGFYSESWPTLSQIIINLRDINPMYQLITFGDCLLAYPETKNLNPSDLLKACSISRLFDTGVSSYSIDDVLESEEKIAQIIGTELENLYKFFSYIKDSDDQYGCLWQALILEYNKEYEQASVLYKKILNSSCKRGIKHWRINYYLERTNKKANILNP